MHVQELHNDAGGCNFHCLLYFIPLPNYTAVSLASAQDLCTQMFFSPLRVCVLKVVPIRRGRGYTEVWASDRGFVKTNTKVCKWKHPGSLWQLSAQVWYCIVVWFTSFIDPLKMGAGVELEFELEMYNCVLNVFSISFIIKPSSHCNMLLWLLAAFIRQTAG